METQLEEARARVDRSSKSLLDLIDWLQVQELEQIQSRLDAALVHSDLIKSLGSQRDVTLTQLKVAPCPFVSCDGRALLLPPFHRF